MKLVIFLCSLSIVQALLLRTPLYDQNNTLENGTAIETDQVQHIRHVDSKRFRSKDGFLHDRYPLLYDINLKYCQRPATCQNLSYPTCMGSKLSYSSTTLDLTNTSSQEKVQEQLQVYKYIRYLPKCWAVIQPFLCALYMPRCNNDMVDLPSVEMCRITLRHCKILYDNGIFPDFMKCEDRQLFPSMCKNDIHDVKFNMTGFCMEPLVRVDRADLAYPDIDNCGLQCKDVLYTDEEHRQIQKLMIYCAIICIILNLFTIVTFIIDWKTANKYPALAIFYLNVCFFISYCGWFVQFISTDAHEDVVCKKDGTLRKHEPSANENLSCVTVFVMVYYFLIAGMVWFVIFTYAWHMSSLQALGKIQERVDKKRAYFHLVAWSLPLILTITTMAIGEIDGDYVLGICFVGCINSAARIGLLLTPLAATIISAGYIVVRGLLVLIRVKIDSKNVISDHSSRKIRSNIVRMGVFALFMVIFCIITFIYHIYIFVNSETWTNSLHNYVICKLTSLSSDLSQCKIEVRPSVAMLQLQLLAVFGSGLAVASWVWCTATFHVWTRYFRRKFHCEVEKPLKYQKHKIIAQAFEKRKIFNEGRKISIECQPHTDPVGLHFDLNSAASNELSTTWAANLPRLVNRRCAVPNEVINYSASSNSEMSYSLQQISIESRRNSGESQLSVQISEVTAKINRRMHRSRPRRKRNIIRRSRSRVGRKRNSTASLDSQLGSQLHNIFNVPDAKHALPNLSKRRIANAGLDGLLANAKLILPLDKSHTDDENVSVTISESKFNVVVNRSNNNLDLSDQLIMKSLRQDLRINGVKDDHYADESDDSATDNSSAPELRQLLQSSLNSAVSTGTQNRSSKQSKTSIDVAVQANASEIVTQTSALENESKKQVKEKHKTKRRSKRK
ncbi:hypothetical protein RI129_010134 [Pyrocoelia pectoralis]|uniref:Protein smoothened n=1 Tax=Pyrocoelia pectoralis TaxID=417401 RepID=A0AAN7ZGN5_9COLE